MGKVLVIGLDGATFNVIDPLIANGLLPNLEKLIRQGCRSELFSTIQPISAPAWSSFMTGMNPGKHGILDFTEHSMDDYSVKFINASYRRGKTLWRILGDFGKRVSVMNVPFTYPPEELNGFCICGMDAPGVKDRYFYPQGLFHEINRKVGKYVIEVSVRDFIRARKPLLFLQKIQEALSIQFRSAKYLMQNKPWDFFIYVCRAPDQVQHFFWKYADPGHPLHEDGKDKNLRDAISLIYSQIDDDIGELLKGIDETDMVIVLSDHGHGGNYDKVIFLNQWLRKLGLLEFKRQGGGKTHTMGYLSGRLISGDLINRAKRVIPRNVKSLLLDKVPFLRDKIESQLSFANIDWSKTKAYSEENRGNIWINVKGRQPQGTVDPASEYQELRERIVKELLDMADPETGKKIVKKVFRREELYRGPYLEKAPDIMFIQDADPYAYVLRRSDPSRNDAHWLRKLSADEAEQFQNASHRLEGILIAKGRGIRKGQKISKGANIIDVAPTVLHLMGVPVPRDMDGQVLRDFLTDEFLAENQIVYSSMDDDGPQKEITAYSAREEDIISERLRGLGYFD